MTKTTSLNLIESDSYYLQPIKCFNRYRYNCDDVKRESDDVRIGTVSFNGAANRFNFYTTDKDIHEGYMTRSGAALALIRYCTEVKKAD